MCKFNKVSGNHRIDPCLRELIHTLNKLGIITLGCCCGHGKYSKTVVIRGTNDYMIEIFSGVIIPR